MKKKINRVSVTSWSPVHFKKGPRTSFDATRDERFYDYGVNPSIRKLGYTGETFAELVNQYKGNSRGQQTIHQFNQFIEIEWSLLEAAMGAGHCSKYAKSKRDDCIRDYAVKVALVKEQNLVPDSEARDLNGRSSWAEVLSQILKSKPKSLPSHTFIDHDVRECASAIAKSSSGQAVLVVANKAPRYWKDIMALNLLANLPERTDLIMPSWMFTTHAGMERKTLNLQGFEVIDLKAFDFDGSDNPVADLKSLRGKILSAGKKIIWQVSGYKRKHGVTIRKFFETISPDSVIIDLDEVDHAAWKNLVSAFRLCGLDTKKAKGTPLIVLKSGTGFDKLAVAFAEEGLSDKIFKYDINRLDLVTTQHELEYAKLSGDTSLSHVIHKVEVTVELDPGDKLLVNDTDVIAEELRTSYTKLYANPTKDNITSLLDRFLKPYLITGVENQCYLHVMLNRSIDSMLSRDFYRERDRSQYLDRSVVGVQINTSARKYDGQYNEFVRQVTDAYGDQWLVIHAKGTKRATIEKYIHSAIDHAFDNHRFVSQGGNYVGFLILAPGWPMCNRSVSEGLIDVTLELRNNLDGQFNFRQVTALDSGFNNGLTIDGHSKLLGLSVHLPLGDQEFSTADQIYENWANAIVNTPPTVPDIPLYHSTFNMWQVSKNNFVQLTQYHIDKNLDKSRALTQNSLAYVDISMAEQFREDLLAIVTSKPKKQKGQVLSGPAKSGRIPGSGDRLPGTGTGPDREKAQLFLAVENFQYGIDLLGRYAVYLKLPRNATLDDVVDAVGKDRHAKEEFEQMMYINLQTWKNIYDKGIFKPEGKHIHKRVLEVLHDELS